jgi:hypothetical protein
LHIEQKKAQENLHGGFQKTAKVIIAYWTEKAQGICPIVLFLQSKRVII